MPGTLWRCPVFAVLILALLNPSLVQEEREALPDVVLVLADRSPSQTVGTRAEQTDRAVAALTERFGRLANLDLRLAEVSPADAAGEDALPGSGTHLFGAARNLLADVPHDAVAGIVLVTDGAVHDAPGDIAALGVDAPVHALITGALREADRRLELVEAPRYGVVDRPLSMVLRVHDSTTQDGTVPVSLTTPRGRVFTHDVPVGERYEMRLLLDRAGMSVARIDVEPLDEELTLANNSAVLAINGVRENLKILLISGEVHTGERIWRSTLKGGSVRRARSLHDPAAAGETGQHAGPRTGADRVSGSRTVRGSPPGL